MAKSSPKPCCAATLTGSLSVERLAAGTASMACTEPELIALVRVVSSGRTCQVMDLASAGRGPLYLSLRSKTTFWLAAPLSVIL